MKSSTISERDAINKLSFLIDTMDEAGHDTRMIRRFFDVGEWLLAFEGIWNVVNHDAEDPIGQMVEYRELHSYFEEYLA